MMQFEMIALQSPPACGSVSEYLFSDVSSTTFSVFFPRVLQLWDHWCSFARFWFIVSLFLRALDSSIKTFHPVCSPPPAVSVLRRLCCHGSCPALLLGTATTCSTAVGHGCPASSCSGDAGRTAHRVGPARDLSSHPAAVAIRGWPVPADCLHANTNCFAFTSSHVSRYHCSYSHRSAHERLQQVESADRQAQTENGKRNV